MSETTNIEWCDHTWSPWEGCQKAAPGCDNCYAEARNKRFAKGANWGPGAPRRKTADWTKPLLWNRKAAKGGKRESVFPSLCDPFDPAVDPLWRRDLFDLIKRTPNLDYLLLTKRIGNAARMMFAAGGHHDLGFGATRALPNVWIGATIVNREEMLRDAEKLKVTPARVHFWSVEPMLGPLGDIPREILPDWVIVGGESGPNARPMHPDWARSLRDQCADAGVPMLFKQWGEWAPGHVFPVHIPSGESCDFGNVKLDDNARVWKVGKKAAGRLLDGVQHDGYPSAR